MKKLTVFTIILAVAATIAIILMRMFVYRDIASISPMEMKLTGLKNGLAVECGGSVSDVHLSLPLSVKVDEIISVSSDPDIAYLKIDRDPEDRICNVEVVAVSGGIAEVYVRSTDGKFGTEKFSLNIIGEGAVHTSGTDDEIGKNQNADMVYVTPNGTKYHLSQSCAGDNADPMKLSRAIESGYAPCKNCAMSK